MAGYARDKNTAACARRQAQPDILEAVARTKADVMEVFFPEKTLCANAGVSSIPFDPSSGGILQND
ncbi:MAG: hypothetical protein ABJZ69_13505 [Hyphomicrobiales bacterium]